MSSGGATLQGSYSGETGTIDEVGFYYGTEQGNLPNKEAATGTSSPFSKAITGLTAGTTYYYKAYVHEYNESTSSYEYRCGSESNFTTLAVSTATVTTGAASSVSTTSATLNGSYAGASGAISEVGFYWSANQATVNTPGGGTKVTATGTSSPFSKGITGLTASTTYYYRAYVKEYNESTSSYDFKYGSVTSFTTSSVAPQPSLPGYLGCYEVPAVADMLNGNSTSGTNVDRGDVWYRYYTTSGTRQIATHAFAQDSTIDPLKGEVRNYTVLYDQDKYAPLWVAYAMHSTQWKKILSGRSGSWGSDPAISLTQQTGLDNAQQVGYSRGHMVSSGERQTTVNQNEQTFYYTNQAPQWQNSFNSGIWSTMESDIVSNSPTGRDTLYIVTGVLYEGTVSGGVVTSATVPTLPSGKLSVPIPSHFYKCLMLCSFNAQGEMTAASGCAYIFTNEAHNGSYSSGITTINSIETRSGFDFFANVPTNLQNSAESMSAPLW